MSRNIRVRIQDKDDDDVSDGEIEDDVLIIFISIDWLGSDC